MLNFMRRFASSLVGKILGALLLLGLAGFGIQNVLLDLGSNTLAKVGNEDVTTTQFQRAYQQQLNAYAQQTGQMPTNEQALQLGIPTSIVFRLASDAAINQFAVGQGIGVSDAKLGEMLRQDPTFQGVLGTFDRTVFQQALQQGGYTEAEYFDLQTRAARRQQLALGLFDGIPVPKTAQSLLNRYRNDLRTVDYFTLNSTNLPDMPAPTDEDLKKFLADHQADYRTKETRTADVLVLTPDALAALPDYQPTEGEVKTSYEATKDQFKTIEKRQVQQVILSDASKEQFFKPGTNFAEDIKAAGLTATDFGLVAKTDLNDSSLADAAFGVAKEGDFAIIPGIGGKRVVGVLKIEAGGVPTFEQVKDQVAKTLAVQKAKAAYADIQDEIETLRAAFKPLKDIAGRYKLPVQAIGVTQGGAELAAVPGLAEENRARVATGIFAATAGKLSPTIPISGTNNVYFDLSKVDVARDQTLEEVKPALSKAWTDAKTAEALKAEIDQITKDLDSGKSFTDVAAAKNQFVTASLSFTRDGDKTPVLNETVANQIFSGGPDSHGAIIDGDGDWLVYHVTNVLPATGDGDSKIADFLKQSNQDSMYTQFIAGIRDEAGIKLNQQALNSVLSLNQSTQ
jgi:peptidyl-prolyl cis-trans isomerase D